jgi:hypothetical protein
MQFGLSLTTCMRMVSLLGTSSMILEQLNTLGVKHMLSSYGRAGCLENRKEDQLDGLSKFPLLQNF